MTTEPLLSPDDVADILGVSTRTLAKWRTEGDPDLPYLRIKGHVRYRKSDVEEFLDSAESDDDDDEEEVEDEDEEEDEENEAA